jgi:hypothetical protein
VTYPVQAFDLIFLEERVLPFLAHGVHQCFGKKEHLFGHCEKGHADDFDRVHEGNRGSSELPAQAATLRSDPFGPEEEQCYPANA